MKQNFIFIITLLTILSIVNAFPRQFYKRDTIFNPCTTGSSDTITVTITPDPLVAGELNVFNVNGTLTNGTIDTDSELLIQLQDDAGEVIGDPFTFDICAPAPANVTCPATTFSLQEEIQVDTLPEEYNIQVQINDANGNTLACATSSVPSA
ncbi:hypothetical protein C1646_666997 [Rhizophagus diaphanus]|nr:hypothetical protein C1646_666997 [Rhizophagus diaphanus] [Rhizophagus sp. MUCL 43196]